jgi:hypothetical protein
LINLDLVESTEIYRVRGKPEYTATIKYYENLQGRGLYSFEVKNSQTDNKKDIDRAMLFFVMQEYLNIKKVK